MPAAPAIRPSLLRVEEIAAIRVRQHMRQLGLTQLELARAAGVSSAVVWHIIWAQGTVTLKTLQRIAVALEVDASELLQAVTSRELDEYRALASRPPRPLGC
jgi:transcriptional regulator with XRE-family HTH domain